jgi:hypothetical protein
MTGLQAIDWSSLQHAYGDATEVPTWLEGIGRGDASAIDALHAALAHQGSVYSATEAALPSLLSLIADPNVAGRERLLAILGEVATGGDDDALLLTGLREPKRWPKDDPRGACFARLRDELPLALLTDPDARVRAGAAYLAAWFGAAANKSAPELAAALAREDVAATKATLVLALGHVARYLATDAHDATFRALREDGDAQTRAAAAVAHALSRRGRRARLDAALVDHLVTACATPALDVLDAPFANGAIARHAALLVVASAPARALEVLRACPDEAAPTVAARAFTAAFGEVKDDDDDDASDGPPLPKEPNEPYLRAARDRESIRSYRRKPTSLPEGQRAVLEVCVTRPILWRWGMGERLRLLGLPPSPGRLAAWLGQPLAAPEERALEQPTIEGGLARVGDALLEALRAPLAKRVHRLHALSDALGPERAVEVALAAYVGIQGPLVDDLAFALIDAAGPDAEPALRRADERLRAEGSPSYFDARGNHVELAAAKLIVAAALAERLAARGEAPSPALEATLTRTEGWYFPYVSRALRALPAPRREALLLSEAWDTEVQPSTSGAGAWLYWKDHPSKAITERVLAHVKRWKSRDASGRPRAEVADPHLRAYADALRAAGQAEDAARCEALLRPTKPKGAKKA